jgi:protease I
MSKAIIISGNLAQDHEFIYPYYRLLEAKFIVDVCMLEGKPVKGILGTTLPPNKDQVVKNINQINIKDYDLLVLPGGVKAMEKVRQEKKIINFITNFDKQKKIIACICSGAQLLISAKVVKDRKIAGYYSMKDDIINFTFRSRCKNCRW